MQKDSKYVMLNCDESNIKKICSLLPGSESPTIIPIEQKKNLSFMRYVKNQSLGDDELKRMVLLQY